MHEVGGVGAGDGDGEGEGDGEPVPQAPGADHCPSFPH